MQVKDQTNQTTESGQEKQVITGAQVRKRIFDMQLSGDYPGLEQQYLAKKLNRTPSAVVYALNDKSPKLLARIVRHLDWLETQRNKKINKVAA